MVQIFNSSTWEAKAGGFISWVLGQPDLPQKGKQTNKQNTNQPTNKKPPPSTKPNTFPTSSHPSSKNPMPSSGLCRCCSQAFTSNDSCLRVHRGYKKGLFSLWARQMLKEVDVLSLELNTMHCLWIGKTWKHQPVLLLGLKETPIPKLQRQSKYPEMIWAQCGPQEDFWWLDISQHSSGTCEASSPLTKGVISL